MGRPESVHPASRLARRDAGERDGAVRGRERTRRRRSSARQQGRDGIVRRETGRGDDGGRRGGSRREGFVQIGSPPSLFFSVVETC